MIVTFCGHSKVADGERVKKWLRELLIKLIEDGAFTYYLGGYGDFDKLAASVVCEMKAKYPDVESILIVPYIDRDFDGRIYDTSLYPPLEDTPKRFCIVKRNQWMVDNSDIVISYITHDFGGAYKTYEYAAKKGKRIINFEE